MADHEPTLTRRVTLEWMAAVSLAAQLPRAMATTASGFLPSARKVQGYGTDPQLNQPVVPWPLIMTSGQLRLAAALADVFLPGSTTAPAPSALGVADFVNEWVSAPYPEQVKDRQTIIEGLRWLDAECARRGQHDFVQADAGTRESVVADIARKRPAPAFEGQSLFFQRFRFLVVSAYYTTPEGFRDIGYTGNVPQSDYPPVTDAERAILEAALGKLGLSDPMVKG